METKDIPVDNRSNDDKEEIAEEKKEVQAETDEIQSDQNDEETPSEEEEEDGEIQAEQQEEKVQIDQIDDEEKADLNTEDARIQEEENREEENREEQNDDEKAQTESEELPIGQDTEKEDWMEQDTKKENSIETDNITEVKTEVLETKEEAEILRDKNANEKELEGREDNTEEEKIITKNGKNEDVGKYKAVFILSYLGILFFLPLVICPESKTGRFHANQGIVLFLAAVGGKILQTILGTILSVSFSGLLSFLFGIYNLALLVLMIIGMVNAGGEEVKPLPVIGGIQIIK